MGSTCFPRCSFIVFINSKITTNTLNRRVYCYHAFQVLRWKAHFLFVVYVLFHCNEIWRQAINNNGLRVLSRLFPFFYEKIKLWDYINVIYHHTSAEFLTQKLHIFTNFNFDMNDHFDQSCLHWWFYLPFRVQYMSEKLS